MALETLYEVGILPFACERWLRYASPADATALENVETTVLKYNRDFIVWLS